MCGDAWQRRNEPNGLLVHYDLLTDLDSEMRRSPSGSGIDVVPGRWPTLVEAATFACMRQRADALVPDNGGVLKDNRVFFREGRSRTGWDLLDAADLDRYQRLTSRLAPADLLEWLHR